MIRSCSLAGLSCIYGTLSVEQNPETGIYDLVLRQMLQIPIIGVNDAPQVSGAWVSCKPSLSAIISRQSWVLLGWCICFGLLSHVLLVR